MAYGVLSANTTIKVNGAVNATGTSTGAAATVYTGPSTGYAILNIAVLTNTGSGVGTVRVGGRDIISFGAANIFPSLTASAATVSSPVVYVGPSQTLQIVLGGSGSVTCVATGVEFVNTP